MIFSVYETKFIVGKSKEMVFTTEKRRGHWRDSTLWVNSSQEKSR